MHVQSASPHDSQFPAFHCTLCHKDQNVRIDGKRIQRQWRDFWKLRQHDELCANCMIFSKQDDVGL